MINFFEFKYPIAGKYVDGRLVDKNIPNYSSIYSSFNEDEIKILKGIREIPLDDFESKTIKDLFYSADDVRRCKKLAQEIKINNYISTLIIVIDKEGPYILEGAHRFGALLELKAKHFPGIIVLHQNE